MITSELPVEEDFNKDTEKKNNSNTPLPSTPITVKEEEENPASPPLLFPPAPPSPPLSRLIPLLEEEKKTSNEEEKKEEDEGDQQQQQKKEAEEYFCQVCFTNQNRLQEGFELSLCRHVFCRDCLIGFLKSKIEDGQVYPKCFHMDSQAEDCSHLPAAPPPLLPPPSGLIRDRDEEEGRGAGIGEEEEVAVTQQSLIDATCRQEISSVDIHLLLQPNHSSLLDRYVRFKFCKENKNARECPKCASYQINDHPESHPQMTCQVCQTSFCFYHSLAHDFQKFPTCQAYDKHMEEGELKSSIELIEASSKACPVCGVMVMKSGGCNHMKCQCGAAFCWLCGKQIEDTLFPAHFQWWNPSGCSNLQVSLSPYPSLLSPLLSSPPLSQMNEAVEPTRRARICAGLLSAVQFIVLGPLTLASTLASTLLCFSCICIQVKKEYPSFKAGFSTIFSTCMSSWGVFWMIVLVIIPLGLAAGGVALGAFLAVGAVIYPCYATLR